MHRNGVAENQHDEEPVNNDGATNKSRNGRTSASRKKYNMKRAEKGREERSTQFFETVVAKAKENLMYGLRHESEVLDRAGENVTRKSVMTSVTTRGVGFGTASTYRSLLNYGDARPDSIYAAYRVGLYAFEAKVQWIQGKCIPLCQDVEKYAAKREFPPSFYVGAQGVYGLPKPVQIVIDCVGNVEVAGANYHPVIPPSVTVNENGVDRFVPLADRVTLSSLRKVVESLSDATTPLEWRRAFFHNNPIPGTIVVDDVLQNPDEIMPPGYDERNLEDDRAMTAHLVAMIQKFVPKYAGTLLSWNTTGYPAMLLSSEMGDLRIESRLLGEDLLTYYRRLRRLGNIKDYWSMFDLTAPDKVAGVIAMLGELPAFANLGGSISGLRRNAVASYEITLPYGSVMDLMFQ